MKKAMHAEILVAIGLLVVVLIIFAIFQGQQTTKTGSKIDKLKQTIFPDRMESVVIPGTIVGQTQQKVFTKKLIGTKQENLKKIIESMKECELLASKNNFAITFCGTIDISGMIEEINEVEINEKLMQMNEKIDFKIGDTAYSYQNYDSYIKDPILANCSGGTILVRYMFDKNVYLTSSERNCPKIKMSMTKWFKEMPNALSNCYYLGKQLKRDIDCYYIDNELKTGESIYRTNIEDFLKKTINPQAVNELKIDSQFNDVLTGSLGELKICFNYQPGYQSDDLTITTTYGNCDQ